MTCNDCLSEYPCSTSLKEMYKGKAELCPYLKNKADYAEVRHGEWKWDERFSDYRCSVCSSWDLRTSNFCSNCGADMRGVKSDV